MELDPTISFAIFLGGLTSIWAITVHIFSRTWARRHESNEASPPAFWVVSFVASGICLLLILQVPDWRLMWIRWQRHDFCALPGHAALYWIFISKAPFAFATPVFAYLAFRLAPTLMRKICSLILFLATLIVFALTIHGLHWTTFWPLR